MAAVGRHHAQLLRRNVEANRAGSRCQCLPHTWGHFDQTFFDQPPFDAVLAADTLFSSEDTESFFATISCCLRRNPECVCFLAYQERSASRSFGPALRRFGLCARLTEPKADEVGSNLSGVAIFHITRA